MFGMFGLGIQELVVLLGPLVILLVFGVAILRLIWALGTWLKKGGRQ